MFVTSSYSLEEGVCKISALKSAKEEVLTHLSRVVYTVLCLNRTRMSIIKKYQYTTKAVESQHYHTVTAVFFSEDALAPLKRPLEAVLPPILLSVTTKTCLLRPHYSRQVSIFIDDTYTQQEMRVVLGRVVYKNKFFCYRLMGL